MQCSCCRSASEWCKHENHLAKAIVSSVSLVIVPLLWEVVSWFSQSVSQVVAMGCTLSGALLGSRRWMTLCCLSSIIKFCYSLYWSKTWIVWSKNQPLFFLTGLHIFIQASNINTHIIYTYTAPQSNSLPSTMHTQDEEKAISSYAAIFNLRNGNWNLNSPLKIVCFYRSVKNVDHW